MSFFGSKDRVSHGLGVSKLLEDRSEDWWQKNLAGIANYVKMDIPSTAGALIVQANKYVNPTIANKFGHLFKGRVNRSVASEAKMHDIITDPCFEKVLDYHIGITGDIQSLKYMYDTYGMPTYGKCSNDAPTWLVGGNYMYVRTYIYGYSGVYPDIERTTIEFTLSTCG